MHSLYDVPAPAKLNLFLHITGRRADGYHLLQSVFMLIDWQDRLHFEKTSDGAVTRQDLNADAPALPADDLIVRAARALQAATGCTQGARIALDKHIPSQAGMGGGSSDAASTLIALNRLWNLGLNRAALARIGLQLGADVPFFIGGDNAWVQGIGEHITPLAPAHPLPAARFVVVKPAAGLDTKGIFTSPLLQRDTNNATIEDFAANHFDFGHNDLQPVAEALCPDVKKVRNWLESLGLQARMTGSGSAVFAQIKQADFPIAEQCSWTIRICENLPRHPLKEWVAD
ncbi:MULTISPECIES: 4-(cytidine 5'-diphospho)-2-C-methyl-D-erythritol kinase [Comamonas]|uniref:4-diphosphocytidyl-2-C-methyl-D-erythritol kinase n=1 Tax=Comamonas terrigena TaxID=32013 RepID=A0A2A7USV3_COMTR|nr:MULTISPECIES: 4-(cytidine 5'-diphospho)-2-C-methyl-D-erythritol kinase [Comamonas]MBD9533124.1 4-(cytidine 5'-diphospho)-2-C-methyl-D-erythritol kinase [Comamonas sp. CMM01]MDH0047848.1 4-(cytidine 5'-diphospho)-2-C-methyl-D-erythritol kinase [Comamonas terrigena]MDH0510552.1 4-(cytidine 5'-diphospho)-2-C-methyl-D-erythritol kinase [Comamonas terrigena]MDH1090154.1 4-(cytidine 5'-diphospho)-2-C-methyl-D-erythritol kinase [Comamonas terrigena]MDH1290075.1 4-(cytidine 5'-diphospho)-2-C-methyl